MAKDEPCDRKRRTREHVIAAVCQNHVERFVVECGFTFDRPHSDYGYDLTVFTFDEDGCVEAGAIYLQLKATESLRTTREGNVFQVDIRDYNLWIAEPMPVFFVLFDVSERIAYWLYVQHYFESNPDLRPKPNAKSVRLVIPTKNTVDVQFFHFARDRKNAILLQLTRQVNHDV